MKNKDWRQCKKLTKTTLNNSKSQFLKVSQMNSHIFMVDPQSQTCHSAHKQQNVQTRHHIRQDHNHHELCMFLQPMKCFLRNQSMAQQRYRYQNTTHKQFTPGLLSTLFNGSPSAQFIVWDGDALPILLELASPYGRVPRDF